MSQNYKMKARQYRLLAAITLGAVSLVNYMWIGKGFNYIFLKPLTAFSGAAAAAFLIAAIINSFSGRSEKDALRSLNVLKKYIIIMLIITAMTFLSAAEGFFRDNGISDEIIYALFALCLIPTEIVVMIIFTIIYYTKKKRYNADAENILDDFSDETKL